MSKDPAGLLNSGPFIAPFVLSPMRESILDTVHSQPFQFYRPSPKPARL